MCRNTTASSNTATATRAPAPAAQQEAAEARQSANRDNDSKVFRRIAPNCGHGHTNGRSCFFLPAEDSRGHAATSEKARSYLRYNEPLEPKLGRETLYTVQTQPSMKTDGGPKRACRGLMLMYLAVDI